MNGISDVKSISGDNESLAQSPRKSEEWPDWSEPEEPENKTVNVQVWPTDPSKATSSLLPNLSTERTWIDFELSSSYADRSPGGEVISGEQRATPHPLSVTKEPLKLSSAQEVSHVSGMDDPDQTKHPRLSSQERFLKAPSELGLGEEFTIQVKKKPVQEPELDWFADMVPEIKPSAAILILPELRTHGTPNDDDISPGIQFSSKFAAAEIPEVSISLSYTVPCLVTNSYVSQ